jgi:hypothetical protein
MARSQIRQGDALRRARERQRELDGREDEAREASRARIAEASAVVLVALERRAEAEQELAAAKSEAGEALRALLAEDVDTGRAAALLDLDVSAVRRLVKAARPAAASRGEPPVQPVAGSHGGLTDSSQRSAVAGAGASDAGRRAG